MKWVDFDFMTWFLPNANNSTIETLKAFYKSKVSFEKDPSRKLSSLFYTNHVWDQIMKIQCIVLYHHHLISKKPWQYFHSCFSLFCVPGKFPELLTFLQSTPWWIIFEVPKGNESDHPSLTPSSSKSLWLYDDDEQKKLKKENHHCRRPPKKKKEPARPFYSFFPLSLDCRLFFYFVYYIENPKEIVSKWWRIVVRPAPNTFCVCSTLYSL